jgi:hypothetical protein
MDEETIARIARERIPGKVDQIRDLPPRLEALGLAGVDRAERAIADTDAMLANQGAGAIQQLGGTAVPTVIADYEWALRLANALNPATRREIADARDALQAVSIAGIIVNADVRAAITDLDSTEEVVDRLPAMRSAVREISNLAAQRARQVLDDARQDYAAAIARIRALPGWDAIDERAQRDITDRVRPIADADADAAPVSPVNALRNAVTTRMLLASQADEALRAAADAIVARRDDPPVVPAPVVPTPDVPAPDVPAPVVPRPRIVQLGLGDLFGARVTITSSADVEAAVNAIRTRLQREIDAGNAVELGA